jgi:hypothetical protein
MAVTSWPFATAHSRRLTNSATFAARGDDGNRNTAILSALMLLVIDALFASPLRSS